MKDDDYIFEVTILRGEEIKKTMLTTRIMEVMKKRH